jgi:hypothetical protein
MYVHFNKINLDIFVTVYQLQTPTWRHQKVVNPLASDLSLML